MAKTSNKVKVGTKIRHRVFGGKVYEGVVESIEKCKYGEKNGKSVSSMDMDNGSKGNYVLCVDNGHWCYGDQVLSIIK